MIGKWEFLSIGPVSPNVALRKAVLRPRPISFPLPMAAPVLFVIYLQYPVHVVNESCYYFIQVSTL
eukprot:scaffold3366_cov109-Cylindrotheca_fusiformis.AAC.1